MCTIQHILVYIFSILTCNSTLSICLSSFSFSPFHHYFLIITPFTLRVLLYEGCKKMHTVYTKKCTPFTISRGWEWLYSRLVHPSIMLDDLLKMPLVFHWEESIIQTLWEFEFSPESVLQWWYWGDIHFVSYLPLVLQMQKCNIQSQVTRSVNTSISVNRKCWKSPQHPETYTNKEKPPTNSKEFSHFTNVDI